GLLVGRALHVPGCFPSLAPPVPVPLSPPLHLSSVPRASAPPARTPLALPAAVPLPEQAASRNRIPAVVPGASRRFSAHRAAHNRAKCIHGAGRIASSSHALSKLGSKSHWRLRRRQIPVAHALYPLCPSALGCPRPSLPSPVLSPAPAGYPGHGSSSRRSRRRPDCAA